MHDPVVKPTEKSHDPVVKWVEKSHDPVIKPGEKSHDPVCHLPDPVSQLILDTPLSLIQRLLSVLLAQWKIKALRASDTGSFNASVLP